jgi:hypothetical protein
MRREKEEGGGRGIGEEGKIAEPVEGRGREEKQEEGGKKEGRKEGRGRGRGRGKGKQTIKAGLEAKMSFSFSSL